MQKCFQVGQTFCKNKCKLGTNRYLREHPLVPCLYDIILQIHCAYHMQIENYSKLTTIQSDKETKTTESKGWRMSQMTEVKKQCFGFSKRIFCVLVCCVSVRPSIYAQFNAYAHVQVNVFQCSSNGTRLCRDLLQLQQYQQCLCVTISRQILRHSAYKTICIQ